MICAIEFVPSGGLRREPLKYDMSPEEIEELRKLADAEADVEESGCGSAAAAAKGGDDDDEEEEEDEFEDIDDEDEALVDPGGLDKDGLPKSLRMDQYDEDEDDDFSSAVMAGGASGMMMRDNVKDKYLGDSDDDEDGGSDAEENVIEASDMVILGARTDEDASILEVNCYDPSTGNLWVHHDITLAAFPLCMAYLDMPPSTRFDGGSAGAYVAVGTFKPAIEIWNLDVIDPLEPVATLGGENLSAASAVLKEQEEEQAGGGGNKKGSKDKKKKKNKAKVKKAMAAVTLVDGSHTDAVMGLAWNPLQRQVLASASADTTVKLWDVTTQQCSVTLSNHQDKVQSVCWHPSEAAVLASGSYDKTMLVLDVRSPSAVSVLAMPADLEDVKWDPWSPERLVGVCEDGSARCYDPRNPSTPLWTIQTHSKGHAASKLAFAPHIRGLFATASTDKTVKLWDTMTGPPAASQAAAAGGQGGAGAEVTTAGVPACVGQREMGVGKLFSLGWCGDASTPWTLACAGSKGTLALWETDENEAVKARFSGAEQTTNGGVAAVGGVSRLSPQALQAESLGEEVGAVADALGSSVAFGAFGASGDEEETGKGMADEVEESGCGGGGGGGGGGSGAAAAGGAPPSTNAKKDKKKKKKAAGKKPIASK